MGMMVLTNKKLEKLKSWRLLLFEPPGNYKNYHCKKVSLTFQMVKKTKTKKTPNLANQGWNVLSSKPSQVEIVVGFRTPRSSCQWASTRRMPKHIGRVASRMESDVLVWILRCQVVDWNEANGAIYRPGFNRQNFLESPSEKKRGRHQLDSCYLLC